mmetsp:Transcript_22523/g.64787  ORF Transcript_22523/g.64787 Transcript_22523/m.64787 type:complete len:207 (-) Transcript_22523:697-1317(-)
MARGRHDRCRGGRGASRSGIVGRYGSSTGAAILNQRRAGLVISARGGIRSAANLDGFRTATCRSTRVGAVLISVLRGQIGSGAGISSNAGRCRRNLNLLGTATASITTTASNRSRVGIVILLQDGAGIPVLLAHLGAALGAGEPVSLGEKATLGPGALRPTLGVTARLGDGLGRANLAGQIGRRGRRLREDARQAAAAAAALASSG